MKKARRMTKTTARMSPEWMNDWIEKHLKVKQVKGHYWPENPKKRATLMRRTSRAVVRTGIRRAEG